MMTGRRRLQLLPLFPGGSAEMPDIAFSQPRNITTLPLFPITPDLAAARAASTSSNDAAHPCCATPPSASAAPSSAAYYYQHSTTDHHLLLSIAADNYYNSSPPMPKKKKKNKHRACSSSAGAAAVPAPCSSSAVATAVPAPCTSSLNKAASEMHVLDTKEQQRSLLPVTPDLALAAPTSKSTVSSDRASASMSPTNNEVRGSTSPEATAALDFTLRPPAAAPPIDDAASKRAKRRRIMPDTVPAAAEDNHKTSPTGALRPVFVKQLTPSDVSLRQDRLLIPQSSRGCLGSHNTPTEECRNIRVVMHDELLPGHRWSFIHGLWPSNGSIIVKGSWSTFCHAHHLRAGDIVVISLDEDDSIWIRHQRFDGGAAVSAGGVGVESVGCAPPFGQNILAATTDGAPRLKPLANGDNEGNTSTSIAIVDGTAPPKQPANGDNGGSTTTSIGIANGAAPPKQPADGDNRDSTNTNITIADEAAPPKPPAVEERSPTDIDGMLIDEPLAKPTDGGAIAISNYSVQLGAAPPNPSIDDRMQIEDEDNNGGGTHCSSAGILQVKSVKTTEDDVENNDTVLALEEDLKQPKDGVIEDDGGAEGDEALPEIRH